MNRSDKVDLIVIVGYAKVSTFELINLISVNSKNVLAEMEGEQDNFKIVRF